MYPAMNSSTSDLNQKSQNSYIPGHQQQTEADNVQRDISSSTARGRADNISSSSTCLSRRGISHDDTCSSIDSECSQSHVIPGTDPKPKKTQQSENVEDENDVAEVFVEDDLDDESNIIVAESPDGRWQRRDQIVTASNFPGVHAAYMAVDTEEGVEVVWNEMVLSTTAKKTPEDIEAFFNTLLKLDHPNVVKFYHYWVSLLADKITVFFITEYMSTGSLKAFLKKTRSTKQALSHHSWKRWCIQLLSALAYLHECKPPIIHCVLDTNTVYIQNNGLIKIGSVTPNFFRDRLDDYKDCSHMKKHFMVPEMTEIIKERKTMTSPVDVYMFGLVALEMLNTADLTGQLNGNTDANDALLKAISHLDPTEQSFIGSCLERDPRRRPSARQLLHHPAVFEIYSLRLLCAHAVVDHAKAISKLAPNGSTTNSSKISDVMHLFIESKSSHFAVGRHIAVFFLNGVQAGQSLCIKSSAKQDLCNFLESVRNGQYPLAGYVAHQSSPAPFDISLVNSGNAPSNVNSSGQFSNDGSGILGRSTNLGPNSCPTQPCPIDASCSSFTGWRSAKSQDKESCVLLESRRIHEVQICRFEENDAGKLQIYITLNLLNPVDNEHMRRNLTAVIQPCDTAKDLVDELVKFGFISKHDIALLVKHVDEALSTYRVASSNYPAEDNPSPADANASIASLAGSSDKAHFVSNDTHRDFAESTAAASLHMMADNIEGSTNTSLVSKTTMENAACVSVAVTAANEKCAPHRFSILAEKVSSISHNHNQIPKKFE